MGQSPDEKCTSVSKKGVNSATNSFLNRQDSAKGLKQSSLTNFKTAVVSRPSSSNNFQEKNFNYTQTIKTPTSQNKAMFKANSHSNYKHSFNSEAQTKQQPLVQKTSQKDLRTMTKTPLIDRIDFLDDQFDDFDRVDIIEDFQKIAPVQAAPAQKFKLHKPMHPEFAEATMKSLREMTLF